MEILICVRVRVGKEFPNWEERLFFFFLHYFAIYKIITRKGEGLVIRSHSTHKSREQEETTQVHNHVS